MKVVTVVGARPQFIKAAVVSKQLRINHKEVLVHTGQHFDYNMSQLLFDELSIPTPDYNLGISGGTHSEMTGKMMISLEEVFNKEKPDWIMVYGDTNSTLAASLAAVKMHIPICHVEAGVRAHDLRSPEEVNRICTDHVSTLLLASTLSSYEEIIKEGLQDRAAVVGDPMYDAFIQYSGLISIDNVKLNQLCGLTCGIPNEYYYLTCHREENTDDQCLVQILNTMEELDAKVIYPVHPRNHQRVIRLNELYNYKNIVFSEPVGYLESLALVKNAKKIITDSGGLQREAFFAGVPCITILDSVIWPETMVGNRNQLAKAEKEDIINKLHNEQMIDKEYAPFGDGKTSEKIIEELERKSINTGND